MAVSAFVAKLKVLIENVEHHVEAEETELFPQVEKQISAEQLEALGEELELAKKEFSIEARAKAASK